jgi:hypothetical protein
MPKHEWVTAEEFKRLTGEEGSVYIGPAPVRRPRSKEVFLCPRCLALLSSPRPGVLRCDSCDTTWG